MLPFVGVKKVVPLSRSSSISKIVKMRRALAIAVCNCVMTPVISVNGLENKLAYIKKLDMFPMVIMD